MAQASIDISVIIPAHNEASHLELLLPALRAGFHSSGLEGEVVVVANGCSDGTAAVCREKGVRCIERTQTIPGIARNAGAASARGRWFAFLDADVMPQEAWFTKAKELTCSNHGDMLAGWPVHAPSDSGWVAKTWDRVRFRADRLPGYVNSGNMLLQASAFARIGGFDESIIAGEDVDLCRRAIRAGCRLFLDPALAAVHYGEPRGLREFFLRELFHADHYDMVLKDLGRSATAIGLFVVAAATLLGLLVAGAGLLRHDVRMLVFLLLGPAVALVAALIKAAARWRPSLGFACLAQMIVLSFVMLAARVIGAFAKRRTWKDRK
jgi:GT2 family glycosyltransferase